jgi:hypothetical protein
MRFVMRRIPVVSGALVTAGLLLAACGGTASPSNLPTVPAINLPSNLPTIPPINMSNLPTIPPLGSFAIPSFAFPSFNTNSDPELAAKFPTQIGGQPVKDVQTVNFIEFMTAFSGDDPEEMTKVQAFVQLLANNNINAGQLAFGSANATVNDEDVELQAFRTPGVPATTFIGLWPQLSQIDQSGDNTPPTVGTATIAGKTVTTFTNSDGDVTYVYPSGDIAWSVDSTDQAVLDAVFAAVQ